MKPSSRRFLAALWLLAWAPVAALAALIPDPPQIQATGYLLMDARSGQVLVAHNADERLPPASLTKMMTAYIAAEEIRKGNISPSDEVLVSVRAWQMGGSRMFIREGTRVTVADLLRGIIIQSGNDATVALAEFVAGSEDAFADLMNQYAERMGMHDTHFVNSTGWPDPNHYSTARDLARLARHIIRDHPEEYDLYAEKSFTYNDITQQNRNLLLWRDPRVDGLKTGHTEEAGYCLVASAKDGDMRLISVVMGAGSEQDRARETQKLLTYGFRFYETYAAYQAGAELADVQVWMGTERSVKAGPAEDLVMTVPRDSRERLQAGMTIRPDVRAPIAKGEELGTITVRLDGETLLEKPLVALQAVEEAGFLVRLWHHILLFFSNLF